jgi:hypothetical protein
MMHAAFSVGGIRLDEFDVLESVAQVIIAESDAEYRAPLC